MLDVRLPSCSTITAADAFTIIISHQHFWLLILTNRHITIASKKRYLCNGQRIESIAMDMATEGPHVAMK